MSNCPVCKNECNENDVTCSVCGFLDLNRTFINASDAEIWLKNTVEPCRAIWRNCKKYKPIGYQRLSYRQCPTERASYSEGNVYAITDSRYGAIAPIQIDGAITYQTVRHYTASMFGSFDNTDDNLGNAVDIFQSLPGVRQKLNSTEAHTALEYRKLDEAVSQECPCLATVIAMYSLLWKKPFMPNAIILGDVSVSGKSKPFTRLQEALEICALHGIRRVILPLKSAIHISNVSAELIAQCSLFFYCDVKDAIKKALQLSDEEFDVQR